MQNKMNNVAITEEEILVAELDLLGIGYLSRQSSYQARHVRAPEALLTDLVRQPHARVRNAVIAVLLARPAYAEALPAALARLSSRERFTLQALYMAAVLLQQEHADGLRTLVGARWRWLPDTLSQDLGVPREGAPRERLRMLDRELRRGTRTMVNWMGTYEQVVQKLIRTWDG